MNFPNIDQAKLQEKLIDVLLHAATREDVKYEISKLDTKLDKLDARIDRLDARIDGLETKFDARIDRVESKLENLYKLGWVVVGTSILVPLLTRYFLH